jgi:hypothetical protein
MGACPVLCRKFNSIFGLYAVTWIPVTYAFPVVTNGNVSRCCQMTLKRQNCLYMNESSGKSYNPEKGYI